MCARHKAITATNVSKPKKIQNKLAAITLIAPEFTYVLFLYSNDDSQTSNGLTLWQQITKEFFNKVYPSEMQPGIPVPPKPSDKPHTTTHKIANEADSGASDGTPAEENDDAIETTTKRYRVTLTRGLSKYGPWGYLILGMLLCGGALLLCVLWGKHHLDASHFSSHLSHSASH